MINPGRGKREGTVLLHWSVCIFQGRGVMSETVKGTNIKEVSTKAFKRLYMIFLLRKAGH